MPKPKPVSASVVLLEGAVPPSPVPKPPAPVPSLSASSKAVGPPS